MYDPPSRQTSYCMNTIVYDAPRKTLRFYRDAKLICINENKTFTLKAKTLQWGLVGSTYKQNCYLDDMRIYDEALSGAQVATLARVVRYSGTIGDAAAEAMPVLSAASPVTVAAGATLEANGVANHAVTSLAGAGTVKVVGAATFRAAARLPANVSSLRNVRRLSCRPIFPAGHSSLRPIMRSHSKPLATSCMPAAPAAERWLFCGDWWVEVLVIT